VFLNKRGFTLIELLVSLVILMVLMMGILESVCVALQHNMENQLRNEGVRVAGVEMAREMARGYANVSTSTSAKVLHVQVMGALKNYSVARSCDATMPNTKSVNMTISWRYKNRRYTHTVSSAISRVAQ